MPDTQSASASYYDLSRYAVVLRRRWWVVALCILLGAGAALAYAAVSPRQVTASSLVSITLNTTADFNAQRPVSQLIDPVTEEQLIRSAAVRDAAASALTEDGYDVTAVDVRRAVQSSVLSDTVLARISYTAGGRAEAEAGADAVGQAYLDFRGTQAENRVKRLTAQLERRQEALKGQLQSINNVLSSAPTGSARAGAANTDRQVVNQQLTALATQLNNLDAVDVNGGELITPAAAASVSIAPHRTLLVEVGLLLGLVIGLIAAFIVGALDRRVRDALDIEKVGAGRVLARVGGLSATFPPQGDDLDALRTLRERLLAVLPTEAPVLAVGELTQRVSDIGPNLAYVLCESGRRVDLVLPDADTAYVKRVVDGFGLTDEGLVDGLRLYSGGPLDVLVAPPGLIATPNVIAERRAGDGHQADFTIVAPSRGAARSQLLAAARLGGAAVLVMNTNKTRKSVASDLVDELAGVGASVYGTVLVPARRQLGATPTSGGDGYAPMHDLPGSRSADESSRRAVGVQRAGA